MKYRKIKKQLTPEEAKEKKEIAEVQIENCIEFIDTLRTKEITGICLIVLQREFSTIENATAKTKLKIEWLQERIKDLQRFL
jgi:hypothetical protein